MRRLIRRRGSFGTLMTLRYELSVHSWPVMSSKLGREVSIDKAQVRSGMLIMPNANVPNAVWEIAETEEMREVIGLYGKTYHFWQVDRGDTLPLGKPELMMSFTKNEQVPWEKVKERDERYGVETSRKKEVRKGIEGVEIHEDVDSCWK